MTPSVTDAIKAEIAKTLSGQSDAERRATDAAEEIAGIVADIQAQRESGAISAERARLLLEMAEDAMRTVLLTRASMDLVSAEAALAVIGKLAVKAIGAVV